MSFCPVETLAGNYQSGILLIADHASRDVPDEYGSLGLDAAAFDRHIAYDIGVEILTRELARLTHAPAVLGGFSRLLIDPNRGEDDPTLIMQLSDGAVISGNYPLTINEREKRLNQFYRPYHRAVDQACAEVKEHSGHAPFVVSIHSYTPQWKATPRPWEIALLWDKDHRAITPLLTMLREDSQLTVGDNQPYDGALRNDTLFRHCTVKGYANVLIEVRQDLITTEQGAKHWAAKLAPMLLTINQLAGLHEVVHFGSRTGDICTGVLSNGSY